MILANRCRGRKFVQTSDRWLIEESSGLFGENAMMIEPSSLTAANILMFESQRWLADASGLFRTREACVPGAQSSRPDGRPGQASPQSD